MAEDQNKIEMNGNLEQIIIEPKCEEVQNNEEQSNSSKDEGASSSSLVADDEKKKKIKSSSEHETGKNKKEKMVSSSDELDIEIEQNDFDSLMLSSFDSLQSLYRDGVPDGGLFSCWNRKIRTLHMRENSLRRMQKELDIPVHIEPSRFELFIDAIFAVLATVLFLPLMSSIPGLLESVNHKSQSASESTKFNNQTTTTTAEDEYSLYISPIIPASEHEHNHGFSTTQMAYVAIITFLLIEQVHRQHLAVSLWVKRENRVIQIINLIVIFLTSLLPFVAALVSLKAGPFSVCAFGVVYSLLGFVFIVYWWYLSMHPRLSRREWPKGSLRAVYFPLVCWILTGFIVAGTAWAFPPKEAGKAMLFWLLMFIVPLAHLFFRYCYDPFSLSDKALEGKKLKSGNRLAGVCSVERFVLFSDAVLAFSATLITADLGVEPENNPEEVEPTHAWPQIVAFFWCLAILGVVWIIHATIIKTINRVPSPLFSFNCILLALTPTIPFGCKFAFLSLLNQLTSHEKEATELFKGAMVSVSTSIFLICISLLLIYLIVSSRRHIWKKEYFALWISQSWYNESLLMLAAMVLVSFVSLILSYFIPLASFVIAFVLPFLSFFWIFFSSFLFDVHRTHEKPLEEDHLTDLSDDE